MGSNVLTTWGYFFPRELYLQQNTQGRQSDARYIFELSHSDCSYATRIEITNSVLTTAQLEYNRIMTIPLQFNRSTSREPFFAIVVGFSTSVRLNMDVIGDLNDCRQSVVASSMYIVPCNNLHVERHVTNRALARNETFQATGFSSSSFVNTAYRFDTSTEDTELRLVQTEQRGQTNEEEEEEEEIMEDDGSVDGGESGNDTDTTPTRETVSRNRNTSRQRSQRTQHQDRGHPIVSIRPRENRSSRSRSRSSQSVYSPSSPIAPTDTNGNRNDRSRSVSLESQARSSSHSTRSRTNSLSSAGTGTNVLTTDINNMQLTSEDSNIYSDDSERQRSVNKKRRRALVSRRGPR